MMWVYFMADRPTSIPSEPSNLRVRGINLGDNVEGFDIGVVVCNSMHC